jgi:hypothetical protein
MVAGNVANLLLLLLVVVVLRYGTYTVDSTVVWLVPVRRLRVLPVHAALQE